jgi:hypothetical protein
VLHPAECSFLTTGQAVIADIFPPAVRGTMMGAHLLAVVSNCLPGNAPLAVLHGCVHDVLLQPRHTSLRDTSSPGVDSFQMGLGDTWV